MISQAINCSFERLLLESSNSRKNQAYGLLVSCYNWVYPLKNSVYDNEAELRKQAL